MNTLQIFNSPEFGNIRTAQLNGTPWFVGKDVASALGYKDTVSALKTKVDPEDKRGWQITTPSGTQEMTIINESGLYCLIFSSKLEKAKRFTRWVTHEVLPSIRQTGSYTMNRPPEISPSGLAKLISITRRVLLDIGASPVEVGAMAKSLLETYGIPAPVAFTQRIPEQLCLFDALCGEGASTNA